MSRKQIIFEDKKICCSCKNLLDFSKYRKNSKRSGGVTSCCKDCERIKYKNCGHEEQNRRRAKNLIKYGLSHEDYESLLEEQKGLCKICGQPETQLNPHTGKPRFLAVDHDHETGKVRGLLCNQCNVGLGAFKDNECVILQAAKYLIESKEK